MPANITTENAPIRLAIPPPSAIDTIMRLPAAKRNGPVSNVTPAFETAGFKGSRGLLLPRMARARDMHPLRVYGLMELGIGACGILVLILTPLVDSIYVAAVGHGLPAILFRGLIAAICLLPPTFLMGASLPAAARYIESSPRGVSWLGFLYGGNPAGAVFGCLLAGFYLLRVYDLTTATLVAAAINAVVGLVSLGLAARTPEAAPAPAKQAKDLAAAAAFGPWPIYVTIAISGATALGAEVVWTRLLGLLLGATVYTFSIIL